MDICERIFGFLFPSDQCVIDLKRFFKTEHSVSVAENFVITITGNINREIMKDLRTKVQKIISEVNETTMIISYRNPNMCVMSVTVPIDCPQKNSLEELFTRLSRDRYVQSL